LHTPVLDRYLALTRDGALERDAAQEAVVADFDRLLGELTEYQISRKSSALGWLFGRRRPPQAPQGLYIWGSVGRGKTMLMDLFYEVAPIAARRRVHFHAFMTDVHARVHAWRQEKKAGTAKGDDPIAPVADALAAQAWLLCFDEFAVTDIADAMILGRLFTALFARGVVVVATSNVEPARLYEGGLNRALFVPFIATLEERMKVLRLDSRTDFRLEKLAGAPVYHVPPGPEATQALRRAFKALTGHERGRPKALDIGGRALALPEVANNVAMVRFHDLCEQPLGPADFVAIAQEFHTVVIDDIPVMGFEKRNEARRFIWLIDALYDMHVKVIASAEAEPPGLYTATDGREVFEFERTASRLIEMRSTDYLALPHGPRTSEASGDTSGLVET
jgi:cell division protein ZapE